MNLYETLDEPTDATPEEINGHDDREQ